MQVQGPIVGVCEERGCWIAIGSDKEFEQLRFKVDDGVIVFPMSIKGMNATVEGVVNVQTLDAKTQIEQGQHMAKDGGQGVRPGLGEGTEDRDPAEGRRRRGLLSPGAVVNWRRVNNVLHRDIGYLSVGLTLAYGVSGLAVNHRADWNPNYAVERTTQQIAPIAAPDRDTAVAEALRQLQLTEQPRNAFRPEPETLQLFFEQRTYSIDLPTGAVVIEANRARPVLYQFNQLHLNTPKGLWTVIADIYAIALVGLAITGMFVLKGRTGIAGRGAWLVGLGILIPLLYWVWIGSGAPGGDGMGGGRRGTGGRHGRDQGRVEIPAPETTRDARRTALAGDMGGSALR